MKKLSVSILFLVLCSMAVYGEESAFGQQKYLEARIGMMAPWGTGVGFKGGVLAGFRFDQMVSLNFNVDYYRANYTTEAQESTNTSGPFTTTKLNSETTANLFLLFLNVRVDIPYVIADIIQPYAQIGVGYDLMYNTYKKTSGEQSYLFAGDFLAFQIEIGAQISLGEKTYLYLLTGYNFSNVAKSKTDNETLIVGEKIDAGGFSILCGVGFKL